MKLLSCGLVSLLLSGCAIAARSDRFGASIDIGIGGILSYVVDLRLKADVGFMKTCNHKEDGDAKAPDDGSGDPLGLIGFL